MSNQDKIVNDTIANMITNLKPRSAIHKIFDYSTPVKRSMSSNSTSSTDETPSPKKAKQADKFMDSTYIGSPREVRRIRSDLISARNTILSLENQIQHMHGIRKEMQIMFDNETTSLRSQHERDRKSIEELESQLQSVRKRELELKNELAEEINKYSVYKIESDKHIEELEKNLCELSEDIKAQEDEENCEITELKRKVTEYEFLHKAAQDDVDAHKKLCEELEKRLSEHVNCQRNVELKDQELLKIKLQIKEFDYIKETHLEIQQQAKAQQHKLSTYGELEKENQKLKEETRRLKDEVHNKLLLEEEVHDLKGRLVNFKEQEKKFAALKVNHAQNEMYLEEWRAVARSICESTGNDMTLQKSLRSLVEHLQQQEINLTSDSMSTESQLKRATHELKVAQADLEKNQKLVTELQADVHQRQNFIHRMQKKLLLVSRERDSYRKQLDSYERDLTICMNPASSAQPGANQIQTQKERIDSLERVVEGYREMVNKLENDLQSAEPAIHSDVVPIKVEQASRLRDEIIQLKNENAVLRERKDQLEIQSEMLLMGQDNVEGRVVHVAKNPLAECIAQREYEKEKLAEEVQKLKRKVRNLEEGLEASKLGDTSVSSKDVQVLNEQVKSLETQIQRLKEYFKSSMQEFRNVIYMLLGYKIDKMSNSQYKLTSMYAETLEDNICFQLNSEGALNLLESSFSANLEDLVELHLRHQKSIPVFLSAITMDLFNNKTMTSKTFVEDDD